MVHLKKLYEYRAVPPMYSVEEAVESHVSEDYGEGRGQVEDLQSRVSRLTELVAKLIEQCDRPEDVYTAMGFEAATPAEVKAWEER